jgi:hypothetical protein
MGWSEYSSAGEQRSEYRAENVSFARLSPLTARSGDAKDPFKELERLRI